MNWVGMTLYATTTATTEQVGRGDSAMRNLLTEANSREV